MEGNYRDSWVSRREGHISLERHNELRMYDFVRSWPDNSKAAQGLHGLESAVIYAEITFPDGTINPVCHAIAIYDMLPSSLKLLKETGHLQTSKKVRLLVDRLKNAVEKRGSDFHQRALNDILTYYSN